MAHSRRAVYVWLQALTAVLLLCVVIQCIHYTTADVRAPPSTVTAVILELVALVCFALSLSKAIMSNPVIKTKSFIFYLCFLLAPLNGSETVRSYHSSPQNRLKLFIVKMYVVCGVRTARQS